MTALFTNNASSRIPTSLAAGNTSVTVWSGEGAKFPNPTGGDWFMVTLEDRRTGQIEICKCTARSGDTLTLARGQEGTTPQAFAMGTTVSNRMTAGAVSSIYAYGYSKAEADQNFVNVTGDTMTGQLAIPLVPAVAANATSKQYVDQQIALISGISEPPNDGKDYARHYQGWTVTISKVTFDAFVSSQASKDAAQDTQLATNTANIATNTANIATNTANIVTNTTNIANNTSDIAAIEGVNGNQDVAISNLQANKVAKGGDTMTGPLVVPGPPTLGGQAANKSYVDAQVATVAQFPEAPNDGKYYGRQSAAWAKVTEEAPADGLGYSRKNGAWAVSVGGAYTDDAPPGPPLIDGQLWWDSAHGILYVYYQDADSYQWVQTNGGGSGGAVIYTGDTAPSPLIAGQMWWRSDLGQLFVYYDDGNSKQWVPASVSAAPVDPYTFPVANMRLYSKDATKVALNNKADGTGTDIATFNTSGIVSADAFAATTYISGGTVYSGQNFSSSTTIVILGTTGAGAVYLRPNGVASVVGQATVDNTGLLSATTLYSAGNITAAANINANQNFQSTTSNVILAPTGSGICYLRPNGAGSSSAQLTLGSTGDLTIADSGRLYGGRGLGCRAGYTGGYGGSVFNTFWGGSALQVWVDGTNLGNMQVASDYRIKKDVEDLTGMWETVKTLRPVSYTQAVYGLFEADNIPRWGFIAHELQEALIMDAATGYKDAPDLIQSPNAFTVIAALTKALQEAMARIEALGGAAVIDFPASPTNNQVFVALNGVTYIWDGKTWNAALTPVQIQTAERRNRIINPSMSISQENAAVAGSTSGYYPADQWFLAYVSSSVINAANAGNSINMQAGTPETSAAAGEYIGFVTRIEGLNIYDFAFGTAGSMPFVLAFQVWLPIAGTYWVAFKNGATDRTYLASYTISAAEASTWVRKVIVVPSGVINSGVWAIDATCGLQVTFTFHCGATLTGVAGFQTGNFNAGPGQALGLSTTNVCQLATVGLYRDPNNTGLAPTFEVEDYQTTLAKCQRYYCNPIVHIQLPVAGYGIVPWFNPVPMRVTPTLSLRTAGSISLGSVNQDAPTGNAGGMLQFIASGVNGSVTSRQYNLNARM